METELLSLAYNEIILDPTKLVQLTLGLPLSSQGGSSLRAIRKLTYIWCQTENNLSLRIGDAS